MNDRRASARAVRRSVRRAYGHGAGLVEPPLFFGDQPCQGWGSRVRIPSPAPDGIRQTISRSVLDAYSLQVLLVFPGSLG
jgi:hypothetical protein